jgi:glutamate dehydrogenase
MTLAARRKDSEIITSVLNDLGETSAAAQFASLLYGDTVPEGLADVVPVRLPGRAEADRAGGIDGASIPASPLWLLRNAEAAFAFIGDKPRAGHKVRIRRVPVADQDVAVVEILNDDMPFLVDSVMGELQARGLSVRQLLHPIFKTERSATGRLKAVLGPGDQNWSDGHQESYIAIYLAGPLSEAAQADLVGTLSSILDEVRAAVTDWKPMQRLVEVAARRLEEAPANLPAGVLDESVAFLRWLAADNFTFLGAREYRLAGNGEAGTPAPAAAEGLGLLRDPEVHVPSRAAAHAGTTPHTLPLLITKASVQARVHRRVYMDCVSVKTYRPLGGLDGEVRFVGLFSSQAYTTSPREIPLLRHKVATVLELSGHPAASHDGKALLNVLDTFPRDELFQIETEDLRHWGEGILDLETRPRVRVFARIDHFDRFVTVLVYAPRDRYTSDARERIGALLAEAYKGRVAAFYPYFTDGPLVRVQFVIARGEGVTPRVDTTELEGSIADIVRTWDDRLVEAITAQRPQAEVLLAKYGAAFPAGYAATFPAERALGDIARIERLGPQLPVAIDFYRDAGEPASRLHAAVYRFGGPISLSQRVPVLENLGFRAIDEQSFVLSPRYPEGPRQVTLHDMVLETADAAPIDLSIHDQRLEACFRAVFSGEADNDNFNRLVVSAGADWRSVAVLRACAAYLRQLGAPFGPRYIADTLHRHAGVTRDLLELFHLRFDPDRKLDVVERKAAEGPIRRRIEGALAAVPSLDEDRILRQVLNLIGAMVRTNFYQRGSDPSPLAHRISREVDGEVSAPLPATVAFKFDSGAVETAPQPRPFREIWVYSPRVEGIHLRFAPIARGGIRWSDRAQDFRAEVLGLVRAQRVKNAVIVPSGAKGGFLPKQLPRAGSRDEIQAEGIAAYRLLISSLLAITDNLKDRRIVAPPRVVRHDGDDPYLVVAADKGTATFSDIANEISLAHDFWLGDAFASGGSVGYDHKAIGITARGAWECVKRHFREMDIDIQRQPFQVVGVGDMSGDVFGNGMLLSEQTRLVAAFDHRDIFIDPDPDPTASFAERKRLFQLRRSSWQDYDKARISKGGGVFSRSAKAIPVSDEMRALLGIRSASITSVELIRAILKCRTDLLWFGGIGTYVRAAGERDEDVGDRANDALRVTAAELNAKVIGEGANLGVTQRGRIEFGQRGGRINTDFIDNSAGVNTSDQEVNIKIALQPATRAGALDVEARRTLLAEMTADVASASLRNNYQQSLALSLAERRSARDLPDYALLMRALEAGGLLDRAIEALPSEMELQERARTGRGLMRSELAVLLSYAKIALQHDLLESRVPDEPQLESWLTGYFPSVLRERFSAAIRNHSLRREIVALGLTNAVVNRGGPAMAVRLAAETGRPTPDVAHAFMAVREVFDLPQLWQRIDALDGTVGGDAQLCLYEATHDLVNTQTLWFLRHDKGQDDRPTDLAGLIRPHKVGLAALTRALDNVLSPGRRSQLEQRAARLRADGVPVDLAGDIARLDALAHAPAVTGIARATGRPVPDTARIYFEIGERLRIDNLAARGAAIPTADQYDRLAIAHALAQLGAAHAAFTREAIRVGGTGPWLASLGDPIARVERTLAEAAGNGTLTVSRLTVAAGALDELAAGAREARVTSAAKPLEPTPAIS